MKYYTINDLKNRFNTCPYYSEDERINYQEKRLIEMIRTDFRSKRIYNERNCWQNEEPQIWGINYYGSDVTIPYPKEVEDFVKTIKKHSGGRNLIVMNEPYFDNCYFAIEKEYWKKKLDSLKVDTRVKIGNAISSFVETKSEEKLRQIIEQLLNDFLLQLNEKVDSLNSFFYSKLSQFYFYTNFYKSPLVERYLIKPTELLDSLEHEKEIMKQGLKPLSHKNLCKFIDNIFELLSDKTYSNELKIELIVDRIYSYEHYLVKKFKEKYSEFENVKNKVYELENEIKDVTERLIKSNKEIYPGSLIIEHAINNGLLTNSRL